ncbi:MAG: DUF4492 domain-containing protein [Paramuribaculum sp.]|nr:DUF4492 domain-containing protein [Paramuribaculum sp.]
MRPQGFWRRALDMYVDGFRNMTVGRTLWALIIVKVIILLVVFKLLFFPNVLNRDYDTDEARAEAVRQSLVGK